MTTVWLVSVTGRTADILHNRRIPNIAVNRPLLSPAPAGRAQILAVAGTIGVLGGGAGSAPRIVAALCDPQVEASEVTRLLSVEPALCARVLRVANSALYGQTQSVRSLDRALMVLGLDAVRGIAAAACLDRVLVGHKNMKLDIDTVVQHSQATAAGADYLARHRFPDLAPDAFIAGLLHNLGTVVQMYIDPNGIAALLAARQTGDRRELPLLEAELAAVGHEECGAVIFEEWRLPPAFIATARYHHSPLRAPPSDQRLVCLINVASALALAGGSGTALELGGVPADAGALQCLGLDQEQLTEAAKGIAARMAEMQQAMLAA